MQTFMTEDIQTHPSFKNQGHVVMLDKDLARL